MALSALEKFQLSDLPDRNECTQGSARVKYPPPLRADGRHIQRDTTFFGHMSLIYVNVVFNYIIYLGIYYGCAMEPLVQRCLSRGMTT